MNIQVLEWVTEAPFSDPDKMRLRPAFSYDDWFARGRAIPGVSGALAEMLEEENAASPSGHGMAAAYALGWLGPKGDLRARTALVRSLASRDINLRVEATAALGRVGDATALPVLEGLLRDTSEDKNVRANACVAIGRLRVPSSEPVLRAAATDADAFIARCADEALRLLNSP